MGLAKGKYKYVRHVLYRRGDFINVAIYVKKIRDSVRIQKYFSDNEVLCNILIELIYAHTASYPLRVLIANNIPQCVCVYMCGVAVSDLTP